MKNRSFRVHPIAAPRHQPWRPGACSLMVLAGLGVMSFALPHEAHAQRVVPPNTLPVLRGVVSDRNGISINRSTPTANSSRLTIDQATLRGIIGWDSFDVGSSAEVLFRHQMGTAASTLNRIYDARPSVIQGRVRSEGATPGSAGGQILLINQNGIVFGPGAQVNTQSLIASTLNITNTRFLSGALAGSTAAFEGSYDNEGNPLAARPSGSVVLTAGRDGLAAPVLQAGQGGSIMIFAPTIDNQGGVIRAPDGQVILAAGSKAYLGINPNENDTTLRGYVVEVEAPAEGPSLNITSLIRNAGEISADRGNVTLAALAVNQEGRISAKTALQANGSIYLKAGATERVRDENGVVTQTINRAGTVVLARGSVTEVTPDADDRSTVPDSQAYAPNASSPTDFRGVIEVQGRSIEHSGTIRAAGGVIKLDAKASDAAGPVRVYLAEGSETSVAGTWADVDFSKNIATFRVTSNELKNSPDQKTGVLRGAEVTVDLREGNNILDLTGYRGLVARTVNEKAAVGGDLFISSAGSVVQRQGATLDASGGGYRYTGGMVGTTRLLGADGKVYDIATAPQALRYTQLLDNYQSTDARWGQTTSHSNPLGLVRTYQPGYTEGKAGGLVNISAQSGLVLDGTLKGGVTVGARQAANAPRGATLRIGDYSSSHRLVNELSQIGSITLTQQASDTLGAAFNASTALSEAQRSGFSLGAEQIFGSATQTDKGREETGFGTVELNSSGRIVVAEGVNLRADPGAALTLRAQEIDIAGDLRLAGGSLTLHAATAASPVAGLGTGGITVRSGATLSTAGEWVNASTADNRPAPVVPTGRGAAHSALNGGSLTLQLNDPLYQTQLERGSVLDVSGGASLSASQRVTAGEGGKLTLANGADGQTNPDWMQAELRGFGLAKGGELTLKVGEALIVPEGTTGTVPAATTRLGSDLFSDHGFAKVNVEAAGGITIAAGTQVDASQRNLVLDTAAARRLASGGDIASVATVQTLPDAQRAPMSVSLHALGESQGANSGRLAMAAGASITTDPKGEISLTARHDLQVDGRLSAAGGSINLTVSGPDTPGQLASGQLHVGANADLSTRGTFVPTPNDRGLVQGTLHDGGSITLQASRTGVQVDAGARLDVSGVSQVVDVQGTGPTPAITQQTIEGHGGTLVVKSQGATTLDGTLLGHAGSNAAAGGSFALELTQPDKQSARPADRRIVVTPGNGPVLPADDATVDARVDVRALTAGGFDKLRLQSENRIEFQQSVDLDFSRGVRLDAPQLDIADGARVGITGATVSLGQSMGPRILETIDSIDQYNLATFGASPALTPRSGTGELHVHGGSVNLYGDLTLNGAQLARIESDNDVQLVGRAVRFSSTTGGQDVIRQIGSLTTTADLELRGSQVAPATRTEFTIAVKDIPDAPDHQGRLTLSGNGRTPGAVYSAGGQLTLEAQHIHQGGTVKAPLGQITMNAGRSLTLAAGSTTSVSGSGQTVLYGGTDSGTQWLYNDGDGTKPITTLTEQGKTMTLNAPTLDVQAGATVDLRGGGDVRAVEFVAGNGGDRDITTAANTYAIVPASSLAAMPYDSHTLAVSDPGFGFSMTKGRDNVRFDSITIGAGAAVPAGEYVLLPARFALLPEAYLVELHTGSAYRNLQPGQTQRQPNGDTLVAARRSAAGTDLQESQTIGVVVRPGLAAAQRASDYNLTGAQFFVDAAERERKAAPPSPWDAGRLLIENTTDVALRGRFEVAAGTSPTQARGRVADIDISANRIAVVDQVSSDEAWEGFLQLEGGQLSNLNGNVLLGGKRSHTDSGLKITNSATDSQIVVANSSNGAVNLSELTLTAGSSIEVQAGSVLNATSATGTTVGQSPAVIQADASGALLRLSAGEQVRLDRGTASAASGTVSIAEGATLSAAKSMLIDATQSTQSSGALRVGGENGAGGSLSLASGQVTLGDVAPGSVTEGLVLGTGQLAGYRALDELVLRGYGAIDIVGSTMLGVSTLPGSNTLGPIELKSLTLDTPVLRGRPNAQGDAQVVTLAAETLTLANNTSTVATAQTGTGTLNLVADRVVLGNGAKAIDGFANVTLDARDTLVSEGKGSLSSMAQTTLRSPRVLAAGGSQQTVTAGDSRAVTPQYFGLTVAAGSTPATVPANETELGGRLALQGRTVSVATTVQARSGQIDVTAQETLTLAQGGLLDARGQAKDFNGTVVTADGGGVSLTAAQVNLDANARIDVSAAAQGGGAGRLGVKADGAVLAGQLVGQAAAGARSGAVSLDLGSLGDASFSDVNTRLNTGGFGEERQLRLRQGDIAVAATDHVAARRVTLAADGGSIDVHGVVGTGAAQGGAQVNLFAADGITLGAGSELRAGATAAGARGGEVRVATAGGELVFDRDARIDVRAGQAGPAGSVVFGVTRTDGNVMNSARLEGTVQRGSGSNAASVDLEATRVYDADATGTDMTPYANDHQAFITATTRAPVENLRDENGAPLSDARVLGATELRSRGNLTLDTNWNLRDERWLADGRPGTLTVRATGNLTVGASIGSVDDTIIAGDTWNLRLAAGADLTAANPLAVRTIGELPADGGSLLLDGANAKLRTGTGRIDLAAGRDIRINNVAATVYTAGRIGAEDTEAGGNNRWAVGGGGISLSAGGRIEGAVDAQGDLWVNEWLRRPRHGLNDQRNTQRTDWWSYRPRFQQGVGTLGGGDIEVAAGGDIRDLDAMLPTSGRTYRDDVGNRHVDVQGGGDLSVRAGGDIVGSSFLVGRGSGRVEAGGDIGVERRTQLHVMGISSSGVPEGAGIDLVAGSSVRLQSVFNPTAMTMPAKATSDTETTGPSFGGGTTIPHFLSFAPNSWAGAYAKSGDVSYEKSGTGGLWRSLNPGATRNLRTSLESYLGVLPPRLSFVAFGGDIVGPERADAITTAPSPLAQVRMLADGDVRRAGFRASDKDPSLVPSVNNYLDNNVSLDGFFLTPVSGSLRMTDYIERDGYTFEVQALNGSVLASDEQPMVFPAQGRVRAGQDVTGVNLVMQNLRESDVSEIRADHGDIRSPGSLEMRGPGRLLMQAGRNVDLGTGVLAATGNVNNAGLPDGSARLTLVAGVHGDLDLSKMDGAYDEITALNQAASRIIDLYRQLGTETDSAKVLGAADIAALAREDAVYARFVALDRDAPRAFSAYQDALRSGSVPLQADDSAAAARLYALLNAEPDLARLRGAGSVAALAEAPGGERYREFVELDQRYGRVFTDYLQRRGEGARPTGVSPIVLSDALAQVVGEVAPEASVGQGSIFTYQTSVQTLSKSGIDLWAPGGDIVVGLTTPPADRTVGIITNGGGPIRSVLSGDFNINQGKVLTAQGGDILLFSSQGSIDAGRGSKTSLTTAPPRRVPDPESPTGFRIVVSNAAAGSGIQTLTSDPDGLGPLPTPDPGDVYLFAPAGSIDAGEAGIRSSGNIVINALSVRNASNISAGGSSQGVPVAASGSLAASIASSGGTGDGGSKAAQDAAKNAAEAARSATASGVQKPNILTVEVLGFGEKNCKEQERDCFAK